MPPVSSDKKIAYLELLREIRSIQDSNIFPVFIQIFDLLIKENRQKISDLESELHNNYADHRGELKMLNEFKTYEKQFSVFQMVSHKFFYSKRRTPWGAYNTLLQAKGYFLQNLQKKIPKDMEGLFKRQIVRALEVLIFYLLSYSQEIDKEPKKIIGIKGRFYLSEHPKTKLFYDGRNKVVKKWITTKGKNQPFAILKLISDKYQRQKSKGEYYQPNQIKISLKEIQNCINDRKKCNQPTKWISTVSDKERLDDLRKNISRLVPFLENELYVEKSDKTAFLVLNLKSSA